MREVVRERVEQEMARRTALAKDLIAVLGQLRFAERRDDPDVLTKQANDQYLVRLSCGGARSFWDSSFQARPAMALWAKRAALCVWHVP